MLALGLVGQVRWLSWFSRGDLRAMVTAQQAPELSRLYKSLATVVGFPEAIKTTRQFRNAQRLAVKILQDNAQLGDGSLQAINQPISRRLQNAIGDNGEVPDSPLTIQSRRDLQIALDKISEDFQ